MIALSQWPPGFHLPKVLDPFEERAGPFLIKEEGSTILSGFPVTERHDNGSGVAQGGFLLTFADFASFFIGRTAFAEKPSVTITLSADFASSAKPGDFLIARGVIVNATRRMVFVRGQIESERGVVLNFSAVMRKLTADYSEVETVKKNPGPLPQGFEPYVLTAQFPEIYGPYVHKTENGRERVGMRILPHHTNTMGAIHGGALLALADATLHTGHNFRLGHTVTLSLAAEFAQGGYVGEFIEARPMTIRSTRGYEFLRGEIVADDRTLLNYHAIIKKFDKPRR